MNDNIEKAMTILESRGVDPDEFIKVGGVKMRVIAKRYYDRRKEQDRTYRERHREKIAQRDKERHAKNPDRKTIDLDRAYHRPFVAVDFEGSKFQGFDEQDAAGNVYPLHRATLCAAQGWKRDYTPQQILKGADPRAGHETEFHCLHRGGEAAVPGRDMLEWLTALPSKFHSLNGYPGGVTFISFAFNYDATQILLDFRREKVWEVTRRKAFKSKRKINGPVLCDGFAVDYLKSKWLKVWKLRYPDDPKKAYKPKIDKSGNPVLNADGSQQKELDSVAYIEIHDTFGFYQSRFTTVSESVVKQGYGLKADHETIVENKEKRKDFDNVPFNIIKHYCHLELVFLSKALTILRDGFDGMGLKPKGNGLRAWSGAGAAAAALIKKHQLKKNHYSPDICAALASMSQQQHHAHHGFFGGRIESMMQGYALRRRLWLYDIASAYPSAMLLLPSMRDGQWTFHRSELRGQNIKDIVSKATILSMFKVKWSYVQSHNGRHIPFYPFPYRTKRHSILFPEKGYSWLMRDEVLAGLKWMDVFKHSENDIVIEQWDEFTPGNDEQPYAFVAELYEMRRQIKTEKEYNIIEKAIKLSLNSLYGKTVQSVGGYDGKPPPCACPYYGAAITAHCRARLLEAALLDPYAIVSFMTDGIVSTRKLEGLPNCKEVFDGDPPPGTTINLGDWEFEEMEGGFFLQSGLYHIAHKSGKVKDRTRGADPRSFIIRRDLKDLMLNEVLPAWLEPFNPEHPYGLEIPMATYITAGAACASKDRFKLIGRFADVKRRIDVHTIGTKRNIDCANWWPFYHSAVERVSDKEISNKKFVDALVKNARDFSAVIDARLGPVLDCLKAGDALRCRFLVPSMPEINPTPDELSRPSYPAWTDSNNPDIDDQELELGFQLKDEDKDAAEIEIGMN